MTEPERTWSVRIAEFAQDALKRGAPPDVQERAAIHLFDSIACAAGAHDAAAFKAVLASVAGSGPKQSTIWFSGTRVSAGDAVLANGTAVRFLDANDVILGVGPGGHPSDNIPVAIAVAETAGATGAKLLTTIALSYDLVSRMRSLVYRPSLRGSDWHEVSISGWVAAAMGALLMNADVDQMANAIAIGASRGYTLKQVRRGQISLTKAAANALVAREAVTATTLAMNGFTGPPEVFEGESGVLATLGADANPAVINQLCAEPNWVIRDVSIKPYPAFGTGQAAVCAAVKLHETIPDLSDVTSIAIRLADTPWTREYVSLDERRAPTTRGSADHSVQFLVAAALLDGTISHNHYLDERWFDDDVRALMRKTRVVPDPGLDQFASRSFPAAIDVTFLNGTTINETVSRVPGSPDHPFGWDDVATKFATIDRVGLGDKRIEEIAKAVRELSQAPNLSNLIACLS